MPDPTADSSSTPPSPEAPTEPPPVVLNGPLETAVWAASFVMVSRDGPSRAPGTGTSPGNRLSTPPPTWATRCREAANCGSTGPRSPSRRLPLIPRPPENPSSASVRECT